MCVHSLRLLCDKMKRLQSGINLTEGNTRDARKRTRPRNEAEKLKKVGLKSTSTILALPATGSSASEAFPSASGSDTCRRRAVCRISATGPEWCFHPRAMQSSVMLAALIQLDDLACADVFVDVLAARGVLSRLG